MHALRGKEHVEWDNPYDVGMTGLIGFSSGYYAMLDCDVLLMLGTDFPYRQFYPHGTASESHKSMFGRKISGGALRSISASSVTSRQRWPVCCRRSRPSVAAHISRRRGAHYAKARKALDELATGTGSGRLIHPQQVAKALSDHAAADAIFTCDVGLPTVWAARYLAMNGKRRLIGSFVHGSMANAMAQAIGAQAAFPRRQVISLSGDGGFSMLMGDFLSLAQLGLPVKVCRVQQSARSGLSRWSSSRRDLSILAPTSRTPTSQRWRRPSASGASGWSIPSEVEEGVATALAHEGPVLIDAVVNRQELAMPPAITMEMAKGFTLFMVRAVMSGRGDSLIELARTNLWR